MGGWLYYNSDAGSFHIKKLCSRLYSIEIEFYLKNNTKVAFEPPFEDLGVTYALQLELVGKPVPTSYSPQLNSFCYL